MGKAFTLTDQISAPIALKSIKVGISGKLKSPFGSDFNLFEILLCGYFATNKLRNWIALICGFPFCATMLLVASFGLLNLLFSHDELDAVLSAIVFVRLIHLFSL